MERRQLEFFLAIAEAGSFTRAAQVLHIAQPSLSYSMRTLEAELYFYGRIFGFEPADAVEPVRIENLDGIEFGSTREAQATGVVNRGDTHGVGSISISSGQSTGANRPGSFRCRSTAGSSAVSASICSLAVIS